MESKQQKALDDLGRDGYCQLSEALSPEEVRRLRGAAFDVATEAPSASSVGVGALHHLGIAYAHPRFTDLAGDTRMLALLAEALTPNIHVYHSHLDIHPPSSSPTRRAGSPSARAPRRSF